MTYLRPLKSCAKNKTKKKQKQKKRATANLWTKAATASMLQEAFLSEIDNILLLQEE